MSLLKLDNEREKKDRLSEIQQQEEIETDQEKKSDALAFFTFFAIAGMFVGYCLSDERRADLQIATIIGTAISLLIFSGLVSLLFKWTIGKWKLAFIVTFCILAVLSLSSVILK